MKGRLVAFAILCVAVFLAGCQVDGLAPIKLSDIDKAVSTKQPVNLTARLLLTFTSKAWCEDLGASLVVTLKNAGLDMSPVACAQDTDSADWHGELRMPVRVTSASDGENTGDLASIAAKPIASSPDRVSIVVRLDTPRLTAAREKLLSLPAAQDNNDARVFGLSLTFMLKNDTAKPAFVTIDALGKETGSEIEIPSGGARNISLSPAGVDKLLHEQAIEAFSLRYGAQ